MIGMIWRERMGSPGLTASNHSMSFPCRTVRDTRRDRMGQYPQYGIVRIDPIGTDDIPSQRRDRHGVFDVNRLA